MSATAAGQDFIATLYDAALDDAAWSTLPGLVTRALDGDSAIFWVREASGGFNPSIYNLDDGSLRLYTDHYRFRDPYATACMRRGIYATAFIGSELLPGLEYRQTEFYTDFASRVGAAQILGAGLTLGAGVFGGIGIQRPTSVSSFGDDHKRRLQTLIPHLGQIVKMRRRLGDARARDGSAESALHSLTVGIVICRGDGAVLFANAAAEATAADRSYFTLPGRGLPVSASRPEQTLRLLALLRQAAAGEAGGGLCLEDGEGGRLFVVVSPLPRRLGSEAGRALVTFQSEGHRPDTDAALLTAMFDLTPAEARLALALLTNESLAAFRARRGVSENTVRAQLTQVFRKTGVANQRELVRLLSLIPSS